MNFKLFILILVALLLSACGVGPVEYLDNADEPVKEVPRVVEGNYKSESMRLGELRAWCSDYETEVRNLSVAFQNVAQDAEGVITGKLFLGTHTKAYDLDVLLNPVDKGAWFEWEGSIKQNGEVIGRIDRFNPIQEVKDADLITARFIVEDLVNCPSGQYEFNEEFRKSAF